MCVVQDPAPQGGFRSSWIELNGASQEVVKTRERLGPIDEVDNRLCLLTVDAWRADGEYAPSLRQDEWPWPGRSTASADRPNASTTVSQVCAF
jgi:hypothetical protein